MALAGASAHSMAVGGRGWSGSRRRPCLPQAPGSKQAGLQAPLKRALACMQAQVDEAAEDAEEEYEGAALAQRAAQRSSLHRPLLAGSPGAAGSSPGRG